MLNSLSSQGITSSISKSTMSRRGGDCGPVTFILVCFLAFIGGCLAPTCFVLLNELMLTSQSYCWPMSVAYSIAAVLAASWAVVSRRDMDKKEALQKAKYFLRANPLHYCVLMMGIQGFCQATLMAVGTYRIGSALMTLSQLISNIALSLLIDQFGLLWAVKRTVTRLSLAGLVVVIGGALIYRLPALILGADAGFAWWWICVGLGVGCSVSLQACFGSKVGRVVGAFRLVVGYFYMSGAVFAILASLVVDKPPPTLYLVPYKDYWMFCCGLIMISLFVVTSMCPRWIPLAVMWAYYSFGQMMTSFVLDGVGFLGLEKKRIDAYQCVGLVAASIGIGVLTYAKQRQNATEPAVQPIEPVCQEVETLCHPEPKV